MNKIKKSCPLSVIHVISEPGDCTRYEYYVRQFGSMFFFMAHPNSLIKYPAYIDGWDERVTFEGIPKLMAYAKEMGCNAHTLAECIRTVNELKFKTSAESVR